MNIQAYTYPLSQVQQHIFSVIQELILTNVIQNPIFIKFGLAGLFINGILSATLLPIPTEMTVTALLASGQSKLPVFIVLATSTTAGGFLGYYIGRVGKKSFFTFPRLKLRKEQEQQQQEKQRQQQNQQYYNNEAKYGKEEGRAVEGRSSRLLSRYGWIAILLSAWIPAIGDLVPMIAGAKKYSQRKFAIVLVIGKLTKAIAVVYLGDVLSTMFF